VHHTIAIFELGRPFDRRMMPWKFRYDISNGSGVIVLTNRQTNTQTSEQTNAQTDIAENNTILATLRCLSFPFAHTTVNVLAVINFYIHIIQGGPKK